MVADLNWPLDAEDSPQTGVDERLDFLSGGNSRPPGL